jgi:hypothetical protein
MPKTQFLKNIRETDTKEMNHEGRFFKYEFRRTGSPLGEGTFKPNSIPSISAFVPETRYRHPQLAACGLLPIPNSQQPKANGQKPKANGQKPKANGQKPTANGQQTMTRPAKHAN